MPMLMFTVGEVADAFTARMRALSDEIAELSDVTRKPLGPGESPAERYHQIAKLGKRLSEAYIEFDNWSKTLVKPEASSSAKDAASEPPASDRSN